MIPKEWLQLHHSCCICDEISEQRICTACQEDFLISPQYRCDCCGVPLEHPASICGDCLTSPPHFDQTFSPFLYTTPLSDLIIQFKDQKDSFVGEALSQLFSRQVHRCYQECSLILPELLIATPLHWRKQWKRGFNQSAILCQRLSKDLNIPIFKAIKRQQFQQQDQKALSRRQRINAMKHAFVTTEKLKNKHVAIIDDVMTTGATANAMAYALKQAGAEHVTVWVLARTPDRTHY